jgi:hypothetical protein
MTDWQQNETTILIANSNNTVESSNNESLESLSEQVAILEERLADCKWTLFLKKSGDASRCPLSDCNLLLVICNRYVHNGTYR